MGRWLFKIRSRWCGRGEGGEIRTEMAVIPFRRRRLENCRGDLETFNVLDIGVEWSTVPEGILRKWRDIWYVHEQGATWSIQTQACEKGRRKEIMVRMGHAGRWRGGDLSQHTCMRVYAKAPKGATDAKFIFLHRKNLALRRAGKGKAGCT